jgi:hypothetical protein
MMAGFPRSERSLQAEAHLSSAFRMVCIATLASMPSRLHVLSSRCRPRAWPPAELEDAKRRLKVRGRPFAIWRIIHLTLTLSSCPDSKHGCARLPRGLFRVVAMPLRSAEECASYFRQWSILP